MTQADRIKKAVGDFGASAKAKLGEGGQPEDQLRNPIEQLFKALESECGLPVAAVTLIGEQSLADLYVRAGILDSQPAVRHLEEQNMIMRHRDPWE